MKKSAEVNMRFGVIKKVVRTESRTAIGKSKVTLPKVTGKVLRTFVDDHIIARVRGKATSPIVNLKQPKEKPGANRRLRKGSLKRIAKGDI